MVLLFLLAYGVKALSATRVAQAGISSSVDSSAAVAATYTGTTWHGKPVYRLENHTGHDMQQLTLYSWSEQKLPLLHIGMSAPLDLSHASELSDSPFTIPKDNSVWFVAPSLPPCKFASVWRWGHQQMHATIVGRP